MFLCISGVWLTSPSGGLGAVGSSAPPVSPSHNSLPFHSLLKLWRPPPPSRSSSSPIMWYLEYLIFIVDQV